MSLEPTTPEFALVASALIKKLFSSNSSTSKNSPHPNLPLPVFIRKTLQAINLNPQIPYTALYFITQLRIKNPNMQMRKGMEFHLIIACFLIAQKMIDDFRWTNSTWSRLAGIPLFELNLMEREILERLSYEVNVPPSEYMDWVICFNKIAINNCAVKVEQKKRDVAMYPDLSYLSPEPPIKRRSFEVLRSTMQTPPISPRM